MLELEDFSDNRLKQWCIHCNRAIASIEVNRDHVPSKLFLSKKMRERGAEYDKKGVKPYDYLPQVIICKRCNSGFSRDEVYLLCVLQAVFAGTLYPDPKVNKEAYHLLRSNRDIVKLLKYGPDGQIPLFSGENEPFVLYPDPDRIRRVILKNARGHAYHELSEALGEPTIVSFVPFSQLPEESKESFEDTGDGPSVWPEMGSRMMERITAGVDTVDGWIVVEEGKYRYFVDWSSCVTVRTVIWEYLATETIWENW